MTRLFYFVLTFALVAIAGAKEIRIGLIGLDTSHVTAFTEWPYVMIWYSDGFGYAPKQCAAVRMYWSAMRLPPQLCEQ